MTDRAALRAIALAGACLAPLAAQADEFDLQPVPAPAAVPAAPADATPVTGEVAIGLLGVAGKNADQAGRYTGLNTSGVTVTLGDIDIAGRALWDSGGTRYYQLTGGDLDIQTGSNLGSGLGSNGHWGGGFDDRLANNGSLGFSLGDQGSWDAGITYDAITYTGNVVDTLYTLDGGRAVLNNNLAPWGGADRRRGRSGQILHRSGAAGNRRDAAGSGRHAPRHHRQRLQLQAGRLDIQRRLAT